MTDVQTDTKQASLDEARATAPDREHYEAADKIWRLSVVECKHAIATALAAKDAELAKLDDECKKSMLDIARERDRAERAEKDRDEWVERCRTSVVAFDEQKARAERAEAQLAETRKAMNYLNDAIEVGLSDQEVSRRAELFFAAIRCLGRKA